MRRLQRLQALMAEASGAAISDMALGDSSGQKPMFLSEPRHGVHGVSSVKARWRAVRGLLAKTQARPFSFGRFR